MTFPSFLCVGAQKAGTSWLFVQLIKHPQIWMPPVKELHFFDHLYVPDNRKWTSMHIRHGVKQSLTYHLGMPSIDWSFVRYLADMANRQMFTEGWYKRCYARPKAEGKVCGDITPEYSMIPEEGIAHVMTLLESPKIIYVVRDPVSRALSQLRMNAERRNLQPDLGQWREMAAHKDIHNRGDYRLYIPRWQQHVSADRLLILPYGDIKRDALGFLRRVEAFLGVEAFDGYQPENRVHESRSYDIPQAISDELRQSFAPQYDYLREAFGEDFLARTR